MPPEGAEEIRKNLEKIKDLLDLCGYEDVTRIVKSMTRDPELN